MTTLKSCPQCGQAVQGRSHKVFCSDACRAQSFRNQYAQLAAAEEEEEAAYLDEEEEMAYLDEEDDAPSPAPVAVTPAALVPAQAPQWERPLHEMIAHAVNQSLQQEAALEAQRQRQALHTRYAHWVQTWLELDAEPLRVRAVRQHLQEAQALSASYQRHDLLNQPAHPAQQRLQLLDKVSDELRTLQRELAEPAPFSLWGKTTPTGTLTFSKKRRQQLRESLLGEV
jgi:endogenous inhibitor of DNA gyrase (YacG/DUF329 family)